MAHTIVHRVPVTGICILILFRLVLNFLFIPRCFSYSGFNNNENYRMTTKCLPKRQDLKNITRKYNFSRPQRRKILGQKMKRTQVQLQRRMSLLRSMITYDMKPAKTWNKESSSPVGPVCTHG